MARARGPGNLVSHAPLPAARTDTPARADYESMIDHDLGGRRPKSYRAIDDGRPVGAADLLLRPISLFLLACTAFVIVLGLWLWQSGVFGQLQLNFAPKQPVPSSSWMGTRQPRGMQPVDASATTSSTSPNDGKAPPADAGPSDDDAPAPNDSAGDNTQD